VVACARSGLAGRIVLLILVARFPAHFPLLATLLALALLLVAGGSASARFWRVRRTHFFLCQFAVIIFVERLERLRRTGDFLLVEDMVVIFVQGFHDRVFWRMRFGVRFLTFLTGIPAGRRRGFIALRLVGLRME